MSTTEIRHDLFVYDSDTAFAGQIERCLLAGLEADEVVVAVVDAAKQDALRGRSWSRGRVRLVLRPQCGL
jgi:hypothetical protein